MALLHVHHELVGDRAVDDTMVVADRHVRAQPDRDGVVDDDRPFLDGTNPQDGDLRLIDDRHPEQRAEHAGVRDGERSTLHVIRRQLLVARARRQIDDGLADLEQALLIGVLDRPERSGPTRAQPPRRC